MLLRCVCVPLILVGLVFDVIAQNRRHERCGIQPSENQYPWLAIIEHEYTYEPKIRIHCTGALVSSKHVVSSADCFDPEVFSGMAKSVRLGHFNSARGGGGDNYTENGTLKVPIETVTIDPDYSSLRWEVSNIQHDVAVITLRDVIPYTDVIRPICLPSVDVTQPDVTDAKLFLTGVSDKDRNNYKIKQAPMTLMDKEVCKTSIESYGLPVVEDNFCATLNEGVEPCQVNSFVTGGVLMNKIQDRYELIGLGIFEPSCLLESVGRIRGFTNMYLYLNWIRSKTIEWACGKQPSEDRFAWLAAIEFKYRNQPIEVQCSGALISRRHVICNAECFYRSTIPGMVRTVRLGLHNTIEGRNCTAQNLNKNCTDDKAVRIPIKAVITHPEFTRSFKESGVHDIALAILSGMVTYSDVIRPICLPSVDVTQLPASDRELYVNEFYYKGPLSEMKRHSSMTYVDKEGCREVLDNYGMILPPDVMCAKQTEDIEPNHCLYPGDLLINKVGDTFELVGLTQLSYCGTSKVFTDVYRSLDWLRSVIPEWTPLWNMTNLSITHESETWLRNFERERAYRAYRGIVFVGTEKVSTDYSLDDVPPVRDRDGCGRRKVEHVELIFSGETTKPGDWPWHVAIYRLENNTYNYICGGTLISKKMVLTAAHCVISNGIPVNAELVKIILGKYNFDVTDLQSQERYVQSIIVHEAFAWTHHLNNDIALLKLAIDASYSDYVQPACIWSSEVLDSLPSNKDLGTVIGWGYDETFRISPRLKQTNAPIIPELTCIEKNPIFYVNVLDNKKKFCAGWGNGTSPCNGDSGGGFFTFVPDSAVANSSNTRGTWYIRGIVSMTPSLRNLALCDPRQYVVFTNVNNYTEWIQTRLLN